MIQVVPPDAAGIALPGINNTERTQSPVIITITVIINTTCVWESCPALACRFSRLVFLHLPICVPPSTVNKRKKEKRKKKKRIPPAGQAQMRDMPLSA